MAATVAHQVPATIGHAGASRSLDKAQAAQSQAQAQQAMGGVVVPGAPNDDASKTSRKLKLEDFARVRTLGTGTPTSILPSSFPEAHSRGG